jgi:biopolymer transport protein ExbD
MKLLLPKADNGKAMSKQNITISVSSDLQYYIDNKPVPQAALEATLLSFLVDKPEPTVIWCIFIASINFAKKNKNRILVF